MKEFWFVKRQHYGGGESVIASFDNREDARQLAKAKNDEYQSDNYYVEKNWNVEDNS